jgi:RecA-family ATPase
MRHHDLHDDGDEIPVGGEASTAPAAGPAPPSGETATAESPPREKHGVLGAKWRTLRELNLPAEPPPRRYLLQRPAEPQDPSLHEQGFLPLGKVGMLAAAGGAGKTMALVQLAVSVATGRPWLGHYGVPVGSRGRVVLALAEEDTDEAHRRLYAVRRGLALSEQEWADVLDRITLLALAGDVVQLVAAQGKDGRTEETDVLRELRERLASGGEDWKLVVLDPLSRWAGSETETDNYAATRFVTAIESLTRAPGNPTVLLSHHTTKAARQGLGAGEATAARGASALTDGVRWVANLVKSDGLLSLSLVKTNYTAPAEDCPLKRKDGGVFERLSKDELDQARQGAASDRDGAGKKPSGKTNGKIQKGSDDAEDPFA